MCTTERENTRKTEVHTMTKNEVIEAIKNEIWMNGFQPDTDERFSPLPFLKGEGDLYNGWILETATLKRRLQPTRWM